MWNHKELITVFLYRAIANKAAAPCPLRSRTAVRRRQILWKILVYEVTKRPHTKKNAFMFQKETAPTKMLWIHIRKRTTRINLPVIVCFYRIPNKRAMSRSTEITVTFNRDKPEKIAVKRKAVYSTKRHSSPPIWSLPAKLTAADTGCEIKAVQRSVIVRLQSRSFEGGWRHLSLRRATRIKMFSKAVATDNKL